MTPQIYKEMQKYKRHINDHKEIQLYLKLMQRNKSYRLTDTKGKHQLCAPEMQMTAKKQNRQEDEHEGSQNWTENNSGGANRAQRDKGA